ncbi:MAG: NlpC/P60 family protein [Cruoricaptor ignavus]|nr:NlpC/P60 family protein [Cruoricaptor ignavus]
MTKAFCNVAVTSLYAENNDVSEMLSQVLYGEAVEILDCNGDFCKIKTIFDGVEGWAYQQNFTKISDEVFQKRKIRILKEKFGFFKFNENEILLSIGSEIESGECEINLNPTKGNIAETAKKFLNIPYLKGGRNFFSVDADGFVQLVFKANGIALPRNVKQQSEKGEVLFFTGESDMGDLAFFENENGEIVHCGIMLNNYQIIHAFGKVRIDELDSSGIFNKELNKHTHRLRFVRRIVF